MNKQQIAQRTADHQEILRLRLANALLSRDASRERARAKRLARRAVHAFIQDNIVFIDMVDRPELHIERAVTFALATKTNDAARNMGARYAATERDQLAKAIRDCKACANRHKETTINYPGTSPYTASDRRCEAHR